MLCYLGFKMIERYKEDTYDYELRRGFIADFMDPSIRYILLSGKAGSGKSTLLTETVQAAMNKDIPVVVMASTNRPVHVLLDKFADLGIDNIDVKTMYSYLGLTLSPFLTDVDKMSRMSKMHASTAPIPKDTVFVIDEFSMVRSDKMDEVDYRLRQRSSNPGIPFGGFKIVLVGDDKQLPPVTTKDEIPDMKLKYGSHSCYWPYYSKVYREHMASHIKIYHLEHIFRVGADKELADIQNMIRVGIDYKNLPVLREFLQKHHSPITDLDQLDSKIPLLTSLNRDVDKINQHFVKKEMDKEHTEFYHNSYHTYPGADQEDLKMVTERAKDYKDILLGVGARVILNHTAYGLPYEEGVEEVDILENPRRVKLRKGTIMTVGGVKPNSVLVYDDSDGEAYIVGKQVVNVTRAKSVAHRVNLTKNRSEYFQGLDTEEARQIVARGYEEMKKTEEVVCGSVFFMPFIYGYALTIHKAQGMEFDRLQINLEDIFAHNHAYVALTRVTSSKGLTIIGKIPSKLSAYKVDQSVDEIRSESIDQKVINFINNEIGGKQAFKEILTRIKNDLND